MNRLSNNLTFLAVGIFLAVIVMGVWLTIIVPLVDESLYTPSERARPMTAMEEKGFHIYKREGCWYCHSMQVRRAESDVKMWAGGNKELVSKPGDYVYMWPALWGTERQGPDLMWIGARGVSIQRQIEHLKEPRKFVPDSIMPSYAHLSEEDLKALATFLMSRKP